MMNYLRRVFRGMFHPLVVPLQLWRLDGVGLVEIVSTEEHRLIKHGMSTTGIQFRLLGEDTTRSTTAYRFYRSAVLAPKVTLEELEGIGSAPEPLRLLPNEES
jgi:hypothetical protein